MAFTMPKLKRLNSGACSARKVIPKDVREEYCALFGGGWEERFYVNAGTSLGEAKRALNDWLGEIERRISVICSRDHENAAMAFFIVTLLESLPAGDMPSGRSVRHSPQFKTRFINLREAAKLRLVGDARRTQCGQS